MVHHGIESLSVSRGVGAGIHQITEKSNSGEQDHRAETFKLLCLKATRPDLSQGEKKPIWSTAGAYRATGLLLLREGSPTPAQQPVGLVPYSHPPTSGARRPVQKHHIIETM